MDIGFISAFLNVYNILSMVVKKIKRERERDRESKGNNYNYSNNNK